MFHGFRLKKQRFQATSGHTAQRAHRFSKPAWFSHGFGLKKVPISKRSNRSADTPLPVKKQDSQKQRAFFSSLPIQSVCHHFVEAGLLKIPAAAGFFSAVFLVVLVALLPADLFLFKLYGGGRACGMLLGRKPSPRSLRVTDPRNRLGLRYQFPPKKIKK